VQEGQGQDRRKFLKQAATVAWASPLILTLSASRAGAQNISCVPRGFMCGTWNGSICVANPTPCCTGEHCGPVSTEIVGGPCICMGDQETQ
jgi:hypothetical protein